jgi:hypothetical protein
MNRKIQTRIIASACVILMFLLACGQITPGTTITDTPTLTPTPITVTPTSTHDITIPEVPDGTTPPPPDKYTRGEIEMHTPDYVSGGEDCVSRIPFTINWETDPPIIKGEGRVDCHFQASGACAAHEIMAHAVTLQGEFATGDLGEKRLLIKLTFDGSVKTYFADCGESNPFTEANPAVIPEQGSWLPLNFEYLDGAKVIFLLGKGEKTIFLHLMK